jgi:FMN reductase
MPCQVVILTGSPSASSRTAALARHVGVLLAAECHHVQLVNIRDLPADALLAGDVSEPVIASVVQQLLDADGVVIASPVYKAAYSGVLKAFLDLLPRDALAGKVVLPLLTGGSTAHVLALDYALRPVLSALGADHVLPGRFVLDLDLELLDGRLHRLAQGVAEPLQCSVAGLSTVLREGALIR